MPDTVDQKTRSRIMARVPQQDTRPEMTLRRALHRRGIRYRLHVRQLPGTPDLVFRRFGAICFVHGCFWHRHTGCARTTHPATRRAMWQTKFIANVERDRRIRRELLKGGWRVGVVWECALRQELADATAGNFMRWLYGDAREFEYPGGFVSTESAKDALACRRSANRSGQVGCVEE